MSRLPPRLPARSQAVDRFGATLFAALGLSAAACQQPLTAEDPIIPGALYDTSGMSRPAEDTTSPADTDTDTASPDVPPAPIRCGISEPIISYGEPTGFAYCASDGYIHRPEPMTCPGQWPRNSFCSTGGNQECNLDTDCPSEHICETQIWGGSCTCLPTCRTDSDCGAGSICVCEEYTIGRCAAAECTRDSDCGPGNLCIEIIEYGETRFVCQTQSDRCASIYDCSSGWVDPWWGPFCTNSQSWDGSLRCTDGFIGGGRPFLIHEEARLAPLVERGDWCAADLAPALDGLTAGEREALADHWAAIGLMEHASVAAFARSAMQLMSLGAPPALLIDTQAAMADETQHALAAFALASAYQGAPVGPGPLPIGGALDGDDLRTILYNTIHEGCIGETTAAVEAAEAAGRVEDPVVRAVLLKIAEDEGRHAVLAWRTIQWALAASPDLRGFVMETFQAALVMPPQVEVSAADEARAGLGIIGGSLSLTLRRQALARVIQPCAAQVLGEAGWASGRAVDGASA